MSTNPGMICIKCGQPIVGNEFSGHEGGVFHSLRLGCPKATDALEATTDRTNTESRSELAQGSTNPKDDLLIAIQVSLPMQEDGKVVVDKHRLRDFLNKYVTLALLEQLDDLSGLAVQHGDVAWGMEFEGRVTKLKRLQRDSQPGGTA